MSELPSRIYVALQSHSSFMKYILVSIGLLAVLAVVYVVYISLRELIRIINEL